MISRRTFSLAALSLLQGGCPAPAPPLSPRGSRLPPGLPEGRDWLRHLEQDLLPFWLVKPALGEPIGNFPSTRCDDGSSLDPKAPCPESRAWGSQLTGDHHVVSMSRQTYGYGVAFHLTGNTAYLELARAGVGFLRAGAFDRKNGATFTRWSRETGAWGVELAHRSVQELAYGLLGISFYYYLTRDPQVLADIVSAKRTIFERYFRKDSNTLQWMLESTGDEDHRARQLVAHLDQLNAYMVLMTPILPEPERSEWKRDLLTLARILLDDYYSREENLFFLLANRPEDRSTRHAEADFGHTIKSMWLLRFVGLITGTPELVTFAEKNGPAVLDRAFLPDVGAWASGVRVGGALDLDKVWWMHCELDQFAGTMALVDSKYASYLPRTFAFWCERFVDPVHGEVWTSLDGQTHLPKHDAPKAWPWKSAYHSFEHVLVGYITAQALHGVPATLHFAFEQVPEAEAIQPYFFRGRRESLRVTTAARTAVQEVAFVDIR